MTRTETKSTFDYRLKLIEVKEEKKDCLLLKILSQRFIHVIRDLITDCSFHKTKINWQKRTLQNGDIKRYLASATKCGSQVQLQSEVAQSCLTPSDPMDCSLPDSSVHGIFQARVLEWGAIAFSPLHERGCNF